MNQPNKIRKIEYTRVNRDGSRKPYAWVVGQEVNAGSARCVIDSFEYEAETDTCRLILKKNNSLAAWFDLVNQSDLKLEYDFEFLFSENSKASTR